MASALPQAAPRHPPRRPPPAPAKDRPRGFTLIELLIVVAVLALLVSILIPSLRKAVERARSAVCMSNQKNCGVAFVIYAEDWQGKTVSMWQNAGGAIALWPALYSGEPEQFSGIAGLTKYLHVGSGVFGCPSNPIYKKDLPAYGRTNYAYAMYVAEWEHDHVFGWNFSKNIEFGPPNPKLPFCQLHTLRRVSRPGEIVWLADSSGLRNWGDGGFGRMVASFNPHKELHWRGRVQLIHNEAANVLFYDGHVETRDMLSLYESPSNITVFITKQMTLIPPE